MVVSYILGAVILVFIAYVLFLFVCSLFVSSNKEYEDHSRFYRALLNGATALALKIMRIRIHISGMEKVPQDTKKLLFVSNHRSNFDPIITWQVFKKWQIAANVYRRLIEVWGSQSSILGIMQRHRLHCQRACFI